MTVVSSEPIITLRCAYAYCHSRAYLPNGGQRGGRLLSRGRLRPGTWIEVQCRDCKHFTRVEMDAEGRLRYNVRDV